MPPALSLLDCLPENAVPPPDYYLSPRPEVAALVPASARRVLEIGCGAGEMGATLRARGPVEVVGIELHPAAAAAARGRLSAVYSFDLNLLPRLPYPAGYFDCITFSDVLEHLPDPNAVLRHLLRYLNVDGSIVVSMPNARHESVVLPLLVDGRWDYVDAGILDRTHLRFFTWHSLLALLSDAGLEARRPFRAVRSEPSPYLERAAAFVKSLGGDDVRFKDEATVIQYLLIAAPVSRPSFARRAPDLQDLWAGSHATRILLAPALEDPADCLEMALGMLARATTGRRAVTIGVALPPAALTDLPASIQRAAAAADGDLLLMEAPADEAGWMRLMAATSLYVSTARRPDLARLATAVGLETRDAARPVD